MFKLDASCSNSRSTSFGLNLKEWEQAIAEEILWNYTVPNTGQYDLRLSIDPSNVVDERDEGNNDFHLVVTGAAITNSGTVPSFAPSILAIILTGFLISWL